MKMDMDRNRRLLRLVACGLAGTAASAAWAQPYVINLSGATLLENFIKAPAATNDYFDIDGDGACRNCIPAVTDQLAPFGLPPAPGTPPANQFWMVHYRAVGSVNGFQELVDFGRIFATGADGVEIFSSVASKAFHNRTQYVSNGVSSNAIFNAGNPGGAPVRSTMPAGFNQQPEATYAGPPNGSAGGIRIDAAPVDVPSVWAVQAPGGTAGYNLTPGTPGYGTNPKQALNKDGTPANFGHLLANLGTANINTAAPDVNTIFDTPIAYAPIACVTNLGTGMTQIDQSDIRHILGAGRLKSGENIVAVTRDSGSGTRNGYTNSAGLDPSWGIGDNIGALSVVAAQQLLGPSFIPTNKVGNAEVETTTTNHRLAVGYAGAERGVNSGWLTGGRLEILAVRNDLVGGTQYSRPTISDVLDNDANGWLLGGPAIFAHFGDPKSAPVSKGGVAGNPNPAMRNVEAAAYLNNVVQSLASFIGNPGGDPSLFTPGEFLAVNFLLTAGQDFVQDPANPLNWIANPNLNQSVQDYARSNNVLGNAAYQAFGTVTLNGKVPNRTVGVVYSDGVANGANYIDQAGNGILYTTNLTTRNRIAGDFNGDGLRNLNDAEQMLRAYRQRNGGPAWTAPAGTGPIAGAPGADAIIEVLGDFNGDGNFNAADIRYWADGLAVDPATGKLDRKKGFEAIDNAWQTVAGSNNFLGTTIAGGGAYAPGYARFDVNGPSSNHTPGFAPIGHDGVIDQDDADYIQAQFVGNPFVAGDAEWSNIAEAVGFDLSGDMTGDLIVNQADLNAVLGILCYADCNASGNLTVADFGCFQGKYVLGDLYADCNGSGTLSVADFGCFQGQYVLGCP
ncbi:MAG: hypothetical protein ACKVU4_11555 [Phycisphaerales bacterium]